LPLNHGSQWEDEDIAELIRSYKERRPIADIARALGRTEKAVEFQWQRELEAQKDELAFQQRRANCDDHDDGPF